MKKVLLTLTLLSLFLSCSNIDPYTVSKDDITLYKNVFVKSDNINLEGIKGVNLKEYNNSIKYGTLFIELNLVKGKSYAIYTSGFSTASKIWIDNNVYKSSGIISKVKTNYKPKIEEGIIFFTPKESFTHIFIEFSNYINMDRSLYKWILIGESRNIQRIYTKNRSLDYLIIGSLFICSILFFLLSIVNIKNRYNIFITLFTITNASRLFFLNSNSNIFLSNFSWALSYRIIGISEIYGIVFILLFLRYLYPYEFSNFTSKMIIYLMVFVSIFFLLPFKITNFISIGLLQHYIVYISALYLNLRLFQALFNKRNLSLALLLSVNLYFLSIILGYQDHISYNLLGSYVVLFSLIVIFIFIAQESKKLQEYIRIKQLKNRNIRDAFTKFVPLDILNDIGNTLLEDRPPGDSVIKIATMMFIDIRGFTQLTEGLSSQESFNLINRFYEIIGKQVDQFNGYVESYGGDGVKVIFKNSPDDAINAGRSISDIVLNSIKLDIGLSIHFGQIVLGTIGSENRIQATAISSVTRILNKIDHFQSLFNVEMIITEKSLTLSSLKLNEVVCLGTVLLQDEEEPIKLYQILSNKCNYDKLFLDAFRSAIKYIDQKQFVKSLNYFKLANMYKYDSILTQLYIKQLEEFIKMDHLYFVLDINKDNQS